ncbi:MAG: hypothetical protein RBT42_14500 [Aquabacterium sp.]|uniref:hypothetical protein n=1 Tax=Aquabacterium sp. TaxID=1872578 RepID=UPI002A36AC8D|nr:hypothetical protein [Aquabacterium sp.]MDX9844954.1 hypothetical protein [Aquabacterium sp.]
MSDKNDLYAVAEAALEKSKGIENAAVFQPLTNLEREANRVAKAWSGSWLGYHSYVYYNNLADPPQGQDSAKNGVFMKVTQTPTHQAIGLNLITTK